MAEEKGSFKVDITSTALEKSVDIAKQFLEKLIGPAFEEAGFLLQDQIRFYRFKRQVITLTKSNEYCNKHNITPNPISLKLLVPLLESASIEDNEFLQDKWAILLGNLVDSEQNIKNHVFPYILGQISQSEFTIIEESFKNFKRNTELIQEAYAKYLIEASTVEPHMEEQIKKIKYNIRAKRNPLNVDDFDVEELLAKKSRLLEKLYDYQNVGLEFKKSLAEPEVVPKDILEKFEYANLIRLGMIKEVYTTSSSNKTLEIPNKPFDSHLVVTLDLDLESNSQFILTELGIIFMKACSEKSKF